jgi:hypothetical protein
MSEEIHRALGRIEGQLGGIAKTQVEHGKKLDAVDKRVTANEIKAAGTGAIGGGVMSAFVLILKETIFRGS